MNKNVNISHRVIPRIKAEKDGIMLRFASLLVFHYKI